MNAMTGGIIRRLLGAAIIAGGLSGCVAPVTPGVADRPGPVGDMPSRAAAELFVSTIDVVKPVAEHECRRRTVGVNCKFIIAINDTPGAQPNAYQFITDDGEPVIVFTTSIIDALRNADEVAFLFGHEAAHHVLGHIQKEAYQAQMGAVILGRLASLRGGDAAAVRDAQELGAVIGARRYSKDFELEADVMGALIAHNAGYDAVRGAAFFERQPDPEVQFLGTHPRNADRMAVVRQSVAGF